MLSPTPWDDMEVVKGEENVVGWGSVGEGRKLPHSLESEIKQRDERLSECIQDLCERSRPIGWESEDVMCVGQTGDNECFSCPKLQ